MPMTHSPPMMMLAKGVPPATNKAEIENRVNENVIISL